MPLLLKTVHSLSQKKRTRMDDDDYYIIVKIPYKRDVWCSICASNHSTTTIEECFPKGKTPNVFPYFGGESSRNKLVPVVESKESAKWVASVDINKDFAAKDVNIDVHSLNKQNQTLKESILDNMSLSTDKNGDWIEKEQSRLDKTDSKDELLTEDSISLSFLEDAFLSLHRNHLLESKNNEDRVALLLMKDDVFSSSDSLNDWDSSSASSSSSPSPPIKKKSSKASGKRS